MNPPSAESVWATVAAHSACVCDSDTFGDLPCLVHNCVAAEVWIVAKGWVCTRRQRIPRGNNPDIQQCWAYEFMLGELQNNVEASTVRGYYGLPRLVLRTDEVWRHQRNTGPFDTLEDLLISTGNYR